jgi:hypothetical protein
MLKIQEALRSGKTPEEICAPLGINFKELGGKFIFSYDMIDSYKFKGDPIVRECRGLILYKDNYDIASYGFSRFFNLGEGGADKLPEDLSGCLVLEKLDGTMVNMWFDRIANSWHFSTRNMIYAEGPVNNCSSKSFAELFMDGVDNGTKLEYLIENKLLNPRCTYVFELTSPENRIVTPYKETKITLLTIRSNENLCEVTRHELQTMADVFKCDLVKTFPVSEWTEIEDMSSKDPTFEGYVIVKEQNNGSHLRVKCKNPAYLALSKMVSSVSEKGFLEVIKLGKVDDTLAYFPEYTAHIQKLLDGLQKVEDTIRADWREMPADNQTWEVKINRKAFAIEAYKKSFPNTLFALYDNKTCLYSLKEYLMGLRDDSLLEMIHKVSKNT